MLSVSLPNHISGRHRMRSRKAAAALGGRLLVERLERRGMLSATAGAFDDAAVEECESIADAVEQDSGEPAIGSPIRCGTSLIVCPVATWSGGDLEKAVIAPTPGEETNDTIEVLGPSTWKLVSCWLPEDLCTLPPATFSQTGDDETIDSGDPTDIDPSVVDPVVDPGSADGGDSGVDPVIIIDPPVDPVPVEPLDIRVQFVSSGEEWACYYYYVGLDGAVRNVSVLATSNEPTITAFVADHADDGSFSIEGSEWGWSISGFPLDLAPPVPETGVFAVPETGDPTDETAIDPIPDSGDAGDTGIVDDVDGGGDSTRDPTLDAYLEFVRENPTWPEDHGAGGIQLQVITASEHLPWIEFGTPGEARAFDAWHEETLPNVTLPEGGDPVVVDPGSADGGDSGVDPVIIVDPPVDPVSPFEPLDRRVHLVSSGEEWACYFYSVGPDGAVTNVSVVASFNEPTIAAFVADHADDGSLSIEDYGRGWSISKFPIDLAPPVPETYYEYVVAGTDLPTDEAVVDPIADGGGLTITDRERIFTAPILVVCDGGFVPGEYPPIGSGETTDVLAQQQSVAVDVQAPAPAPAASFFSMPTDVMATVAANSPATGGDTPLPFGSGRRRR